MLFELENMSEGMYKYSLIHDDGEVLSFMDFYIDHEDGIIRLNCHTY